MKILIALFAAIVLSLTACTSSDNEGSAATETPLPAESIEPTRPPESTTGSVLLYDLWRDLSADERLGFCLEYGSDKPLSWLEFQQGWNEADADSDTSLTLPVTEDEYYEFFDYWCDNLNEIAPGEGIATPAPDAPDEQRPDSTIDPTDALAAMQGVWNDYSATERQALCDAVLFDPQGAYNSFADGFEQTAGDALPLTLQEFTEFYSTRCGAFA